MNTPTNPQARTLYWERHVSAWRKSGKRPGLYAAQNGLKNKAFSYWCRKLRTEQKISKTDSPASRTILPSISAPVTLVPVRDQRGFDLNQTRYSSDRLSIIIGERFRILITPGYSPSLLAEVIGTLENIR